MRKEQPNWDLRRIDRSFPYLRTLMRGKPERPADERKHPPMDRGHRAKIFAPFDALDGYSEMIRQKDRLGEEAAGKMPEENMIRSGE